MAVLVSSPLKRKEIKNLLTSYEGTDFKYSFIKEEGIKLYFDAEGDCAKAVATAKKLITSTNWGRVLYFSAMAVD